jgi:ketosteroid isomerase-like protein
MIAGSALKPEDWPKLFTEHLNAGDLDAVMALYESEARFVARSGETLVGHDQIRKVPGGMIDAKTRLDSRVIRTVAVGDIAQLYTDFEGTTVDHSGNTIAIRQNAVEVLRCQPNGTWKLIIGDPNARNVEWRDMKTRSG